MNSRELIPQVIKNNDSYQEYVFQKTDLITVFKENCTQSINNLIMHFRASVSELGQNDIRDEYCFELDRLIAT